MAQDDGKNQWVRQYRYGHTVRLCFPLGAVPTDTPPAGDRCVRLCSEASVIIIMDKVDL